MWLQLAPRLLRFALPATTAANAAKTSIHNPDGVAAPTTSQDSAAAAEPISTVAEAEASPYRTQPA